MSLADVNVALHAAVALAACVLVGLLVRPAAPSLRLARRQVSPRRSPRL